MEPKVLLPWSSEDTQHASVHSFGAFSGDVIKTNPSHLVGQQQPNGVFVKVSVLKDVSNINKGRTI